MAGSGGGKEGETVGGSWAAAARVPPMPPERGDTGEGESVFPLKF